MASHLLLLPWWMTIAGYQINSNNSNSQQQPTTGYKQVSNYKSLPGVNLPTRVKTTRNTIYVWQFKYANSTVSTVLCMSNDIICGYIIGVHFCLLLDKRIMTSRVTWNLPQSIAVLWILSHILYTDNFMIILLIIPNLCCLVIYNFNYRIR